MVLLHLLHQLAPRFSWQLSALHVHHGISPNADAWADFCSELCAGHQIPLHIEHVDITPLRAHGVQAAARKPRHAAFAEQACDFVALAHHADDQAETLLLQLLRGAGVRGASAMPVLSRVEGPVLSRVEGPVLSPSKRPLLSECADSNGTVFAVRPDPSAMLRTKGLVEGHGIAIAKWASTGSARTESKNVCAGSIVRPLLHCSRREILDYAAAHGQRWIEDESNADDSYPRNFLRHRLLPLLEKKFPAYRDTLTRSARHFAEASSLLDELAQQDSAGAIHDGTLAVAALQVLSQPRAKNLLRYFLHGIGAPMPQAVQLDDMLHQLCNARADAAVCIAYGGYWELRRYQGRVHVLRAPGEFDRSLVLQWHGEAGLDWPALSTRLHFNRSPGAGISLAKLQRAPVTLRLRCGGESLRPHPNAAMRTLKNLLQERCVPPWLRDRLPLLYCGDELVCVSGVAIAAEYQAAAEEAGIQLLAE